MKNKKIAVMGATGAVGREMLTILEEYGIPEKNIIPLSSSRSAGKHLPYSGGELTVRECTEKSFDGADIVLGATGADTARHFAPSIKESGAVFIDNSSAFRMRDDVPLVIPEINGDDALRHNGIISNPNCSTIITLMAVYPLHRLSPIERMVVSTYQAVSGAGRDGMEELIAQNRAAAEGRDAESRAFAHRIAENLIPKIGGITEKGYTSEEMKMQNEGRKILHTPTLAVTCTCVRVPVMRSHSISAAIYTREAISVSAARGAIDDFCGDVLYDVPEEEIYPMPITAEGKNDVYVGRIRRALDSPRGIALWCSGDQIRKGAAANAVQIAEYICKK